MAAFNVTLKIDQGSDFSKIMTWKAGEAKTPVDLTGCTAQSHFRATTESPNVLLNLTTANGGIVLGGVTGSINIVITAGQTEGVTWRAGFYDLELTFPDNKKRRIVQGKFSLVPEVTRG